MMRTALVLTENSAFNLQWDRREAERRAFATERVCNLVAMGLIEGADRTMRTILDPWAGYEAIRDARRRLFPGYVFLRDFLVGELDADPIIAARVAARHTAQHNRLFFGTSDSSPFSVGREFGWQ
jgi:hypothetical protein